MPLDEIDISNRMLASLQDSDLALLAPHLEKVDLPSRYTIAHPDALLEHIYFPDSGIGAVMSVLPDGKRAEAGMFGREGFVPTSTIIGDTMVPYLIEMQVGGSGYRIPIDRMRDATARSSTIQLPFIKFMHVFAVQVSYTALANAKFRVEQRLARWILMCHDRVRSDTLEITHEYIAFLLGIRRPSVTTALHILEGHRLIRSNRGSIVVINRKGLERFTAGCYGLPEREFERLIGA
ncbi:MULTISPECIES: Crp/Fnr family transcriptional regulator [Rhizobium]|uniref:Crp/Fnr family transcriptional regulator n=1 Tax=Rhizobium TaxID=379 RepID=UPI001FEFB578|nr:MULTISPECIES: Crp/Fnr family transcriptional regulator [Rhizobium]